MSGSFPESPAAIIARYSITFFEVLFKHGKIEPFSFHTLNPMASLPSYMDKGGNHIVFLRPQEKEAQVAALEMTPSLHAAYIQFAFPSASRSFALNPLEQIEDQLPALRKALEVNYLKGGGGGRI